MAPKQALLAKAFWAAILFWTADAWPLDVQLSKKANISNERGSFFSQVEDANARRIHSLFQLLEHRPEAQTCNLGRSSKIFRFYCPTPSTDDMDNGWRCITMDDLCNNVPDCPGAEDEDLVHCMFYVAIQKQTQLLRKVIIEHYQQDHSAPQQSFTISN